MANGARGEADSGSAMAWGERNPAAAGFTISAAAHSLVLLALAFCVLACWPAEERGLPDWTIALASSPEPPRLAALPPDREKVALAVSRAKAEEECRPEQDRPESESALAAKEAAALEPQPLAAHSGEEIPWSRLLEEINLELEKEAGAAPLAPPPAALPPKPAPRGARTPGARDRPQTNRPVAPAKQPGPPGEDRPPSRQKQAEEPDGAEPPGGNGPQGPRRGTIVIGADSGIEIFHLEPGDPDTVLTIRDERKRPGSTPPTQYPEDLGWGFDGCGTWAFEEQQANGKWREIFRVECDWKQSVRQELEQLQRDRYSADPAARARAREKEREFRRDFAVLQRDEIVHSLGELQPFLRLLARYAAPEDVASYRRQAEEHYRRTENHGARSGSRRN